jgi:uncharacterized lipoprotein YmbA
MPRQSRTLLLAACTIAALAGCAGSVEKTHHYVMDSIDHRDLVRPVSAQDGPVIAVAPVVLPEYLNQNGIVTRDRSNEITRAEFHQWAGPLSEEIGRAVTENLSAMLGTDRVLLGATRRSIPVDYVVDIEVVTFERRADSNAVDLIARWAVFRGDERNLLAMRRARFSTPVSGPEYGDTVGAMSKGIRALSEEIAAAMGQGRHRGGTDRWAVERKGAPLSGDAPARAQTGRK